MAILAGKLLPASFRGAPFAVVNNDTAGGRRVALHQYPGRDDPWAEDMGRAARIFRFRGFIVDNDVVFAGGAIQLQRALLIAALEAKGSGQLTHPTLGLLTVSVRNFAIGEDLGASVMSTVDIEFVETGKRQFPSLLGSSGLLGTTVVTAMALAADGVRAIAVANAAGAQRKDLVTTASTWSMQVLSLGADATALHRLASELPGNFGRFAAGGNAGATTTRATAYAATTTVAELVAAASTQRAAIGAASATLGSAIAAADLGYATDVAVGAAALVDALADACADPADAIRILVALAVYAPTRSEAWTPIGIAFGRLIKRAIGAALTATVGEYQPSSSNDAAAKILLVGSVLDTLALDAADAGDDQSFKALRANRNAVVADLRTRGATLASLKSVRSRAAGPSLALAQRFYRDADRAPELEAEANPVHPLFMPTAFQALAS